MGRTCWQCHIAADVAERLVRRNHRDRCAGTFRSAKTEAALTEWARLLAPQGRSASAFHRCCTSQRCCWRARTEMRIVAQRSFTCSMALEAYTGDYHLAGFTAATLERHLLRAGLFATKVGIKDEWLFEVEASKMHCRRAHWPEPRNLRIDRYVPVYQTARNCATSSHSNIHPKEIKIEELGITDRRFLPNDPFQPRRSATFESAIEASLLR